MHKLPAQDSTNISKFPPLINDLVIRAAKGEKVNSVPIWIMRQAGRYLPEFRELRTKHDFFKICRTPSLACEVTLQPLKRFSLDAAIIFSDILVIPQALGLIVEMVPGVGPKFPEPLANPSDLDRLNSSENICKELSYVYESITLTRHHLGGKCPLIGFAGAPWTLMSYMIEGGGSPTHSKAKRWLYAEQEASHCLLSLLTDAVVKHLVCQATAGAQLLQVFESHAGALTRELFVTYALPCLRQISERVHAQLVREHGYSSSELPPLIIFAKDAHYVLDELINTAGYDVVGLDWTIDLKKACTVARNKVTIQGNLDPCALYAPEEELKKMVENILSCTGRDRFIFNLGHGIYPDCDPNKVEHLINLVHQLSST